MLLIYFLPKLGPLPFLSLSRQLHARVRHHEKQTLSCSVYSEIRVPPRKYTEHLMIRCLLELIDKQNEPVKVCPLVSVYSICLPRAIITVFSVISVTCDDRWVARACVGVGVGVKRRAHAIFGSLP